MTPVEASFSRYVHATETYRSNDPPVEVNQRWIAYVNGEVYRRLRILALHPDPEPNGTRRWIYVDEPAAMKRLDYGDIRVCSEFNLRFVFDLEQTQ